MTDDASDKPVAFPIVQALMTLGLSCVVASGLISGLLVGYQQPQQAKLSILAAVICGGAGLLGLVPIWAMSRSQQYGAAYGFMASILFRMFVAGGAVLVAQWVLKLDYARPLSMWIAGWYMLVLIIEVALVMVHVKATYPSVNKPHDATPPSIALKSES